MQKDVRISLVVTCHDHEQKINIKSFPEIKNSNTSAVVQKFDF